MEAPWYVIEDADQLDTPALVIYPQRVRHNIRVLTGMIDDVARLRIHVKTHKAAEPTRLLLQAGIRKFKCATIAEAEMLGSCGAPDVLLAYQPEGPKLQRLIRLIHQFPGTVYSGLVDNITSAIHISAAAVQAGLIIKVYIDLNVGMNRTGIKPDNDALELYRACASLPGLEVMGLHAYDGHIHHQDYHLRRQACDEAFAPVAELRQVLIAEGFLRPAIIAGGSPTFPIHAEREEVECSPGTFIYWDWGYGENLPEQGFLPAALVLSRVVSVPSATQICLDAGHKSVSAENPLNKRIHFINAPRLNFTGHSEEHLMAATSQPHQFTIGEMLYGMPYHVCPTVALYERAITVEDNRISGEWKTVARDRKISI